MRSLPIGLLLTIGLRKLPQGIWWLRIFVLGVLNIGIFQAFLFVSAYRLPGGVAATVGAVQPLLVIWFAWLMLSEKPSKLAILAAIAGFIGVGLLVLGPSAQLDAIGVLAAIGGALTMGLGTVLVKKWKSSRFFGCIYSLATGGRRLGIVTHCLNYGGAIYRNLSNQSLWLCLFRISGYGASLCAVVSWY